MSKMPGLPPTPRWSVGRVLSAAIALVYFSGAVVIGGPADSLRIALFLALPMLCIWYPDVVAGFHSFGITKTTPEVILPFFGWALLILPMVLVAIMVTETSPH